MGETPWRTVIIGRDVHMPDEGRWTVCGKRIPPSAYWGAHDTDEGLRDALTCAGCIERMFPNPPDEDEAA